VLSLLQPAADKIVSIGTYFPFAADVAAALVLCFMYTSVNSCFGHGILDPASDSVSRHRLVRLLTANQQLVSFL